MLKTSIVFIVFAGIEIMLALKSVKEKAVCQRLKSYVRIAEFLVFVGMALTSIFAWGFQWYLAAIFLAARAVMALVSIIADKEKPYQAKGTIISTAVSIVLFFFALLAAFFFPDYHLIPVTGEYEVATATYTYTDENRLETYTDAGEKRQLTVSFYYPQAIESKCPLVVFSHGGMGIRASNTSLYHELASWGYVVCSLDHTYQCLYSRDAGGHTTFISRDYMHALSSEDAEADPEKSYECYSEWMKIRMGDLDFVIDYILEQAAGGNEEEVYRLVDVAKIAVMGHSLGGAAALGIGRTRSDISAVMALESPFMFDIIGVEKGEFIWNEEEYPIAVLNVYSDSAWPLLNRRRQYAENNKLLAAPDADTFNAYIQGTGHFTLTDLALRSPLLARILNGRAGTTETEYCLQTVNRLALDFFDCYLKGEGPFACEEVYGN